MDVSKRGTKEDGKVAGHIAIIKYFPGTNNPIIRQYYLFINEYNQQYTEIRKNVDQINIDVESELIQTLLYNKYRH